ncbi:Vpu protein [Simian immunodeficiency virus]|uniref:Protein Vpu n=1 Tax=Simian immunodeficiency virus TaxID=11723 RepID=Q9Q073_SIV|nr:Vpu protein [Simian immunodeficiency virus]
MLTWEQIGLIGIGIEIIIAIVAWGIAFKEWRKGKEEENRAQKIRTLIERIISRQEDSGNESDGEDQRQLDREIHVYGFDNPMFDW